MYADAPLTMEGYAALQPLIDASNGGPASFQALTGVDDDGEFAYSVFNAGTGGHLLVPGLFSVTNSGTAAGALSAATFSVSGTLTANGNVVLGDAAGDLVTVNGTPTFLAASTFKHNVTIENAVPTVLAFFDVTAGAQKVTLGPAATPNLYADVQNGRTMIGSTTALTSANNDKLSVIGGSFYVASATDETAIGVRYAPTATGSFFFGAGGAVTPNTPDGVFKNAGGTQIARMFTGGGLLVGTNTALAGSEKLEVQTGGLRVTAGGILLAGSGSIDGNGGTAGQLRIGAVIVNAANLDGSEELLVNGQSKLKGATEITTGGLSVTGGAIIDSSVSLTGTGTPFFLLGSSQTATTVGAAGGASALPGNPSLYVKITIGATDYKFPVWLA